MNKEDYFKYYIQGSDHYLIPKDVFNELFDEMVNWREESKELKKQNDSLKQKLNWIAFGDDSELALRYLRKIGYVDFDEERKVYINKHNNEPFLLEDEQEKGYYIKDNELNEYTEQLEYQIKELKKQLEETINLYTEECSLRHEIDLKLDIVKTQQKEFIEYLEKTIIDSKAGSGQQYYYQQVLEMYKEIIGVSKR